MQRTITSPASGSWHYPDAGVRATRNTSGSKQIQKDAKAVRRSGNDFLTTVFKPIPISKFHPAYCEESYMYLYHSAQNYARLLGADFTLRSETIDIEAIYNALRLIMPKDQYLEIKERDNSLRFVIFNNHEENVLYYVPCNIIDQAEDTLKDIYISFFSIFQSSQGLLEYKENACFEYFKDELPEPESDETIDGDNDWLVLLDNYLNGEIGNTLGLLSQEPKYTNRELRKCIKAYKPQTEKESVILNLMHDGLKLFTKGCIMNFASSPVEGDDFYLDYYPVEMGRMMHVVYSTEDVVFENIFEWICNEANDQGYEFFSSGYIELNPKTRKPMKVNKYVELFLDWINKFCYELYNRRDSK
ncbi:hypothetical protein [Dysgonomonas sp. ZJ709]|uniref:hypothetical protein n=1 Tax=Dysgonomonas sp. ZJ709 TaxID=2709797 RepID=UPI0013EB7842|nr:hypothetical protein [Dysgonomonas sp. ZJ709]